MALAYFLNLVSLKTGLLKMSIDIHEQAAFKNALVHLCYLLDNLVTFLALRCSLLQIKLRHWAYFLGHSVCSLQIQICILIKLLAKPRPK